MKGIVFCEFVDMVESHHSPAMMDSLIESVNPASGGAYTSVGTYDYQELVSMVVALSTKTQTPVETLLQSFGHHLAATFARKFRHFFDDAGHLFAFLQSVQRHIHTEVLKLYPDAELPHFSDEECGPGVLRMIYRSRRPLEHLALGLIEGSARHYAEPVIIAMHTNEDQQGKYTEFLIRKQA